MNGIECRIEKIMKSSCTFFDQVDCERCVGYSDDLNNFIMF